MFRQAASRLLTRSTTTTTYYASATVTIRRPYSTEVIIPICAVIGILFSLFQWYLVSQVKLSPEKPATDGKNGFTEALIKEEEGINDHTVVQKCAEIQNAISEAGTGT